MATLADRLARPGLSVAAVLVLLTWTGDALAKDKPPKTADLSAVAQYRESIPTSSGPTLAGSTAVRTRPLPPPIRKAIARSDAADAPLLVAVATSSAYGTPQRSLPRTAPARPRAGSVPTAVISAPGRFFESAGRGRLLGLIVVLVGVSAVAVVGARRR